MSVTLIFNRICGQAFDSQNVIEPRPQLFLRGDTLVDQHGWILAEREVVDGRVFWKPIGKDNDPGFASAEGATTHQWLCQEIAIVGQVRLNI